MVSNRIRSTLLKKKPFAVKRISASEHRSHAGSVVAEARGGNEGEHIHRDAEVAKGDRSAKANRRKSGEDNQSTGFGQRRHQPVKRPGSLNILRCLWNKNDITLIKKMSCLKSK